MTTVAGHAGTTSGEPPGREAPRSFAERLLDVVVYAPIGAADLLVHGAPRAVETGRRRIEQQVRTARWVGEMAVTVGRSKVSAALARRRGPRQAPPVTATGDTRRATVPDGADGHPEPFTGYDSLPAVDLVPMLARLSHDELEAVLAYETSMRARQTVLARVEQLLAA